MIRLLSLSFSLVVKILQYCVLKHFKGYSSVVFHPPHCRLNSILGTVYTALSDCTLFRCGLYDVLAALPLTWRRLSVAAADTKRSAGYKRSFSYCLFCGVTAPLSQNRTLDAGILSRVLSFLTMFRPQLRKHAKILFLISIRGFTCFDWIPSFVIFEWFRRVFGLGYRLVSSTAPLA